MFYSEAILSRRGPLGRVWLAAHMERKLSKTQTLQTDIEESVGAIMGQDVEIMALRLSGQLLLGVVRIYSRKAKYLLEDCNEALLKIKMAFRPGAVDMGEGLVASKAAITLQQNEFNINLSLPDLNWDEADHEPRRQLTDGRQHLARAADITLPPSDNFGLEFDFFDDEGGIGSQDVDLGIDFGPDGNMDVDMDNLSVAGSVGVGRDAVVGNDSIGSHLLGDDLDFMSNRSKSRGASEHPFDNDMNVDMPNFDDINMGEFGIGFDLPDIPADGEKTPGQDRSPSRASSPLTDVPVTPPPDVQVDSNLQPFPKKAPKKFKEKKQIIDEETELAGGLGRIGRNAFGPAVKKDLSDILIEPHFLPRSSMVMRLLEIRNDPIAHFLPTKVTPQGTFLCTAPAGLAPELAEMFLKPMSGRSKKRTLSPDKAPSSKRQKLDDDEVEQARREGSLAPSIGFGSELGRASMGPDGGFDFGDQSGHMEDFQLEVPPADIELGGGMNGRASVAPSERSRMSTPGFDGLDDVVESYADETCPIAMFDVKPSTQSQLADREQEAADVEGKGYSKNTIKALSVVRRELKPLEGADDEKVLGFQRMADKASRRAAASFFFELLVLGTRDCVKLTQDGPFENIQIRAKDKLWDNQQQYAPQSDAPSPRATSRQPSVARSLASSMGL
ncbi:Rec8 like protein-domain-containing protein [Mucidula mucida]|nr:Rec8 like protein-domain-containing protein [Mucidula mucida]